MITKIEGKAIALSPVVHGGDSRGGTLTEFRREKAVVDGKIELLPAISGNAIRGQLRDQLAVFSLEAAGIEQLTDLRAFHLLFSGGSLVKSESGAYIDTREEKALRTAFPALSLLGGSVGNRILGGKVDVGEWVPVCREWSYRLPEEMRTDALSIYDLLDILSFTRRDDTKNRRQQQYLDVSTLSVEGERKESLSLANEAEETGAAQQMRYSYECLIPGTEFFVRFDLHAADDVEMGTFLGGLSLFATKGTVGGRGSSGMGRFRFDLQQVEVGEPASITGELATGKIEAAREHIRSHREEMLALLESIYG